MSVLSPPCCLSLPCGWRKLKQGPINWLHSHSACPLPFVLTTETPLLKEASDYFIRTNKRLDEAWCDSWIIHWVYVKGDNSFDSFFFVQRSVRPWMRWKYFANKRRPESVVLATLGGNNGGVRGAIPELFKLSIPFIWFILQLTKWKGLFPRDSVKLKPPTNWIHNILWRPYAAKPEITPFSIGLTS